MTNSNPSSKLLEFNWIEKEVQNLVFKNHTSHKMKGI